MPSETSKRYVRPGVTVINGAETPSIKYPLLLPCPLYLCADVFAATVTTNVVVVPCIALRVLYPFNVGVEKSVELRVGRVLIPVESIFLTVISGVPVNPCALVATVAEAARVAFDAVPVRLPVTFPVRSPTNPLTAVTIPDAFKLPVELKPTPDPLLGSPPTWKVLRGSVVAIPTLPPAL